MSFRVSPAFPTTFIRLKKKRTRSTSRRRWCAHRSVNLRKPHVSEIIKGKRKGLSKECAVNQQFTAIKKYHPVRVRLPLKSSVSFTRRLLRSRFRSAFFWYVRVYSRAVSRECMKCKPFLAEVNCALSLWVFNKLYISIWLRHGKVCLFSSIRVFHLFELVAWQWVNIYMKRLPRSRWVPVSFFL